MAAADYVVVGSGLTGATIARTLADAGASVVVLERREHVGGNVHDFTHASGIRVHTYGPHYFRTNSPELWEYVNRFSAFHRYEAAIRSFVDGRFEAWPVTRSYLQRVVGETWTPSAFENITNFEDACLAMMPSIVYEKFVRGYTEKQWGVPANTLSKDLAGRFDVRADDELRLSRHRYQGIPANGYAAFMRTMLDDIPVELDHVYSAAANRFAARKRLIFSGPIDEFFGFTLGRLAYRGQRREVVYLDSVEQFQPCGQVNNPDPAGGSHIRTLEWKHMMAPQDLTGVRGTVITRETPYSPQHTADYEYPFPDARNRELYQRYRELASSRPDVLFCGRLGEYRYYDMDQAIARAQMLAQRLLEADGRPTRSLTSSARHGAATDSTWGRASTAIATEPESS
jgi:UDP-galactopyranose mutase